LVRQDGIIVIPQATRLEHVRENRAALTVELSPIDLASLEFAFPALYGKQPPEQAPSSGEASGRWGPSDLARLSKT
jgi:diketogulonate reductase-like aldo/keto reductase